MTFEEVKSILSGATPSRSDRLFHRTSWKPGTYIYAGDPPVDIFHVDPSKGLSKWEPKDTDVQATDWEVYDPIVHGPTAETSKVGEPKTAKG